MKKQHNAPYIPNLISNEDVSNFDLEFTECPVNSYGETTSDGKTFSSKHSFIQISLSTRVNRTKLLPFKRRVRKWPAPILISLWRKTVEVDREYFVF